MTDQLEPHEEQALTSRLAGSVPDAPARPDRGSSAARAGRRRQRRVVVAAGLAPLAVAAAIFVPLSLDDGGSGSPAAESGTTTNASPTDATNAPPTASEPMPTVDVPQSCVPEQDLSPPIGPRQSLLDSPATWLRFCPLRSAEKGDMRNSRLTLTHNVAKLVADWSRPTGGTCPYIVEHLDVEFRLQVGYADGSVHELTSDRINCDLVTLDNRQLWATNQQVFEQTMTAMGEQLAADLPVVEPATEPFVCPPQPKNLPPIDVTSGSPQVDADFPSPLPATRGILCRYDYSGAEGTAHRLTGSVDLGTAQAEQLRVAYHTSHYGMVDCGLVIGRPIYLVLFEDTTGVRRTITVDLTACGTTITNFNPAATLSSQWFTYVLESTWRDLSND